MLKKLKTVHKVLLTLVLVVAVFAVWSISLDLYSNDDDDESAQWSLDQLQKWSGQSSAAPPQAVTPVVAHTLDRNSIAADPDKQPPPTESNKLNDKKLTDPKSNVEKLNISKLTDTKLNDEKLNVSKLGATKLNEGQQLAHAKSALAEKLTINSDEIQTKPLQRVTWRSSATGCPKPGRNYMQVLVPGVLIQLEANGTTYRYHASSGGRPFYCPAAQAETPSPSQDGALQ